jgi:LPXTG-motif cell wall-anchored protein
MWRGALTRCATVPSRGVTGPRRIAVLGATLALAVHPAAAPAQNGAGDEQYQDPFAGSSAPAKKPKPKPAPKAPATPQTQTQAQSQTQPVPQQQVQSSSGTSAQGTTTPVQTGSELPRTGFDVVPLAIVGFALVLAGMVLRRRAAHGRD